MKTTTERKSAIRTNFPEMTERLNAGYVFGIFMYWMLSFVLFPFVVPLLAVGSWDDPWSLSWIDCIYYAVNGLLMLMLLKEHLRETWFNVEVNAKEFAKTVAIAIGLTACWIVGSVSIAGALFQNTGWALEAFPMSEMWQTMSTRILIKYNPVVGTICLTLFVPFTFTGMFYATGFAPACCKKPWLGYITVTLVTIAPVLFEMFWRETGELVFYPYILRLPVHWLACWAYQKTDCVWAPLFVLAPIQLLSSIAIMLLLPIL